VTPWSKLHKVVEPFYPKGRRRWPSTEGTIVDATLIAAPPSTKNKDGNRDPEIYQSKNGNDWHFGMNAHIGADAASGLVHSVVGTAGNVSDMT